MDHGRSTRRRTGGRRKHSRDRKKSELGRQPAESTVGETDLKVVDARGGVEKVRVLQTNVASVSVDGETVETEITNVVENPANPNYARRNLLTKGAIIETGEGRARVTSRPGQDGQINAVLLE